MWNGNSILRWRATLVVISLFLCAPPPAQAQESPLGEGEYMVVVIKGKVDIARRGSGTFDPASLNQRLYVGDHVRIGVESQLTMRRGDQSIYRFNEKTEFQIQGPRTATSPRASFRLLAGILYFFHRDKPTD